MQNATMVLIIYLIFMLILLILSLLTIIIVEKIRWKGADNIAEKVRKELDKKK
jgi:ABC-type cobalt transport system substrate-binding protein